MVRQRDGHNCGVFSYRWLEQRACNSIISYTSQNVDTYLRVLLQAESHRVLRDRVVMTTSALDKLRWTNASSCRLSC